MIECSANDSHASVQLATALTPVFRSALRTVVVCIGTDRFTGDALGPLVGTLLQERVPDLPVRGTIQNPVHATNLAQVLWDVRRNDIQILAVDACLGKEVGTIVLDKGPLCPGSGVGKDLPAVGDWKLQAVVNVGPDHGPLALMVLQSTRLATVLQMAGVIARGIATAYTRRHEPRWPWYEISDEGSVVAPSNSNHPAPVEAKLSAAVGRYRDRENPSSRDLCTGPARGWPSP